MNYDLDDMLSYKIKLMFYRIIGLFIVALIILFIYGLIKPENPKTRDDLLYLYYKENIRDITELTFLQRIFLSRLVFKVKTKTVTYFDVELSSIKNPIIIEVDNVS